jgi:hypothetical protein
MSATLAALASGLCLASPANADDLTWSYASARVATCQVGSCQSNLFVLGTDTDQGPNSNSSAGVFTPDYIQYSNFDFGRAFSSAEAGDGPLSLPVLHAFALGTVANGANPPFISVNTATVQGVQGFTNTGTTALIIPLSAFSGAVDFLMSGPPGNPGTISAGLAITTSAILQQDVADLWFASAPGTFGQFAANCGTTGALAFGNPAPAVSAASGSLNVSTTSCTGEDTYLLKPGDSFYIWARLSVLRTAQGATDASHTFNIEFSPEVADGVEDGLTEKLMQSLAVKDGEDFTVPSAAAVPEPATWAMMILGFGAVGAMARRRRSLVAQ